MMIKRFPILILCFIVFNVLNSYANEEIVFNKVWKTATKTNSRLDNVQSLIGSGFKFISSSTTFALSGGSGNDVTGTLEYVNSGVLSSIEGTVSGKFVDGGTATGFYFYPKVGSDYYILVIPGQESQFVQNTNYNFNSSGIGTQIETLKTTQQNNVIVSVSSPATVTESSDVTYVTFSVIFSKNRGGDVIFTPTLTYTTTSAADFTGGLKYSTNGTSYFDVIGPITVPGTVNTVYIKIQVTDDSLPELDEKFVLNTNTFTGTYSSEIDNISGAYGIGTISDNNDPLIWTGNTDDSWTKAANWNPSDLIPRSYLSIKIPAGQSRYPIVESDSTIKYLEVESGAKVTVSNNKVLSVTNNLVNNGDLDGDGKVKLNGTITQIISGNGNYKNLVIDNSGGVNISAGSNMVNLTGILTLKNGPLTTNNNLTFKSKNNVQGVLGVVDCNLASIIGNVTVERLIPGSQRAFRFLTPGLTTPLVTGTIKSNWQEDQNNISNNYASYLNSKPNYGTHITGSKTGSNGFDASYTGNPSLFTFNNSTQAWVTVTNTDVNTLKYGEAYRIMIRGSRAVDISTSNTPTPDTTTLRSTGQLCTCTTIFNSTGSGTNVNQNIVLSAVDDTYSLVGNPYWSYVNWHSLNKTNISNTYYIWDPTIEGNNKRGGYAAWLYNSGDGSGVLSNGTSSKQDKYIQPGQSFLVKTTGPNPSLTFNESDKFEDNNGRKSVFSIQENSNLEVTSQETSVQTATSAQNKITIYLYLKENLNKRVADAATLIYGKNWSDKVGIDDADKLSNPDENLAILRNGKLYAIEGKNILPSNLIDTVNLKLWNLNKRSYVIRIDAKEYAGEHELYLVDKSTGMKTRVANKSFYDYTIVPASNQKELLNYYLLVSKPATVISAVSQQDSELKIYPNPVTNILNISLNSAIPVNASVQVNITDFNGTLVLSTSIAKSQIGSAKLDVSKLKRGIYVLELVAKNKKIIKKIIKI